MAETKQVTLKRYNGTDQDTLHPETHWDQLEGKPSTFTPTAHTLNSHTDVNASPTDGQALVWDGTNSLWIAGEGGGSAASVTISETEPSSPSVGDLWWDSTEGNLYIYYDDGSSSQWVQSTSGVSAVVSKSDLQSLYIYGKASGAITKGQAVQFAGAQGDHILIKAAVPSEINSNPTYMIGIADSDLSTNDFGYVIINGRLNLDTSTYSAGDILYFASAGSTAGALTTTEPTGGTAIIQMAAVSVDGVDNGEFVVRTNILSREIHEIIDLQDSLDDKSDVGHTHTISDVTGLQSALDAKATPSDITTAITNLVNGADAAYDTLKEIQDAMATDAELSAAISALTIGNGTQTISTGGGLTGGGAFTANQTGNSTVTVSHADTSSQASVNNSGRTYIQDITLDTYGHITGITSATETVVDTNTTYSAGSGLSLTGTTFANTAPDQTVSLTGSGATTVSGTYPNFTISSTDTNTNTTYTAGGGLTLSGTQFSHTDTSSQASVNNSGRTYIQDITLDTYGHITGISSATETVVNTDTNNYLTGVSGSGDGTVTFTRSGLGNLTWNAAHSHSEYLPLAGGTMTGTLTTRAIAMQNYNLTGVNEIVMNDPGPNEGLAFNGNFKIWESPDDLTTNSSGNLQFVSGGARRLTVGTDGIIDIPGGRIEGSSAQSHSHGSISIGGSKGGYSGIAFPNANAVFMVRDSDQLSGVYYNNSTWRWYFDGSGVLQSGTIPWARVSDRPDPTLTLSGDASGSATFTDLGNATLSVTVANDSHTHDGRYYTETESDNRYVQQGGTSFSGTYPLVVRVSDRNFYSDGDITFTGSTSTLSVTGGVVANYLEATGGSINIGSQDDISISQAGRLEFSGRPLVNLRSIKNWSGVLTLSGTTGATVNEDIADKKLLFEYSNLSGTTVNRSLSTAHYYDGTGGVRETRQDGGVVQGSRYYNRFVFARQSATQVTIYQPYYDYETFSTTSPQTQSGVSLSQTLYLHNIYVIEG